jgi:hypothetical protein
MRVLSNSAHGCATCSLNKNRVIEFCLIDQRIRSDVQFNVA